MALKYQYTPRNPPYGRLTRNRALTRHSHVIDSHFPGYGVGFRTRIQLRIAPPGTEPGEKLGELCRVPGYGLADRVGLTCGKIGENR